MSGLQPGTSARARMAAVIRAVEEALFPGRCLLCGAWLTGVPQDDAPVCDCCRHGLEWIREPRCERCGIELISERTTCMRCRGRQFAFLSNVSLFSYTGRARRLATCLKFEGRARLAPWFAGVAAAAMRERGWTSDLVPVPSRPDRKGPDAVELVARALERRHGFTIHRLLARTGGPQQKTLDYHQRKANLVGRIRLDGGHGSGVVPPRAVVLDDVFTTGATIDACARVLREAGCNEVRTLTLVMEE